MFRNIVVFLFMLPVCFVVQGMNEKPWVVIVNEKDDVIYFNENHYSNNSLDLEKSIEALYPNGFCLKNTNRDAVGMVIADKTVENDNNWQSIIYSEKYKTYESDKKDEYRQVYSNTHRLSNHSSLLYEKTKKNLLQNFDQNFVEDVFFEINATDNPAIGLVIINNIKYKENTAAFASRNLNLIFTMCSILGLSLGMWYGSVRKTYFET